MKILGVDQQGNCDMLRRMTRPDDVTNSKHQIEIAFTCIDYLTRKILRANISRWANFIYFFQKKYLPISIFSSMKLFCLKNNQNLI